MVPREGPTIHYKDTVGQSHTRVRPDSGTTTPGVSSKPFRSGVIIMAVTATLYDLGSETAQSAARESAEDWSAPPASQNANLLPLIEAPAISLAARHTKVRRAGYSA